MPDVDLIEPRLRQLEEMVQSWWSFGEDVQHNIGMNMGAKEILSRVEYDKKSTRSGSYDWKQQ